MNCLDEHVFFMAGPKPMLTEFGIHQRLESCGKECVSVVTHRAIFKLGAKKLILLCLLVKNCLTVLIGVIFDSPKLTVPGIVTIFTTAELKEHLILDNLAISDLQIITATGSIASRSGNH